MKQYLFRYLDGREELLEFGSGLDKIGRLVTLIYTGRKRGRKSKVFRFNGLHEGNIPIFEQDS